MKFLLIVSIVFYLLYKLGLFRASIYMGDRGRDDFRNQNSNGDVHVHTNGKKSNKGSGYKGGEYIDYEEVED